DVRWAKSLAFTLGAGLAGAAGTLYAAKIRIISPDSFTFSESVTLFSIVVLGGLGSIPGVIVAAGALMVLPDIFRDFLEYRMLVGGEAMIVVMFFGPQGLCPGGRWVREPEAETGPGPGDGPARPPAPPA